MAKKPKAAKRSRGNAFLLYLDDSEDAIVRECAPAAGMSRSTWIRTLIRSAGEKHKKKIGISGNS